MSLKYELVRITPSDAAYLLEKNTYNRKVNSRHVSALALSMKLGEFQLNGESIKIAEDGSILDGQHRLHAIIESYTALETLVIRGVEKSAQETMDLGKSRNAADVLSMRGYANVVELQALASRIVRYEKVGLERSGNRNHLITLSQIVCYIEANPDLQKSVSANKLLAKGIPLAQSDIGILRYHFELIDKEDADYFFARLKDGVGLASDNPILVLKNQFTLVPKGIATQSERMKYMAWCVKSWNKFRSGQSATRFNYVPGGSRAEAFPEAI